MVGDGGGVPPKKGFVGACLPRPGDTELLGGGRRPQLSPLPAPALGRGKGAARPHRVPPSKCPEILRGVPHHGPTKSLGFVWVGGGWRCCPPKKTCTPHIALGTPKLAHSVPMHRGPNASTHCDPPPPVEDLVSPQQLLGPQSHAAALRCFCRTYNNAWAAAGLGTPVWLPVCPVPPVQLRPSGPSSPWPKHWGVGLGEAQGVLGAMGTGLGGPRAGPGTVLGAPG